MSLIKSTVIVSFFTFISRILGYIRDIMLAFTLGTSWISDAFFIAYRLPNMFRRIFAEGAFSAAFVPLFSNKLAEDKNKSIFFASNALSILVIILLLLCLGMELAMAGVTDILAYGFKDYPEQMRIITHLCRITTPYLLMISIVAFFMGILNSFKRFAIAASSSVILNVIMLTAMIYAHFSRANPAYSLAWAIFISGIVQVAIIWFYAWRKTIAVKLQKPVIDGDIKRLFKNMLPVAIGSGVTQISMVIDTAMATQGEKWISFLYYADRLSQLPLGIIGIAISTVILPSLAQERIKNNTEKVNNIQNRALEISLLLTIPCAIGLAILAEPIIRILFERGEFDYQASQGSAGALLALASGIPAFILTKIIISFFYSAQNTTTPLKIALVTLVVGVLLNLLFIPFLAATGIALSTSISAWLNVILLIILSYKDQLFRFDQLCKTRIAKICLASLAMTIVVLLGEKWLGIEKNLSYILKLFLIMIISSLVFFIICHWLGAYDKEYLKAKLCKKLKK